LRASVDGLREQAHGRRQARGYGEEPGNFLRLDAHARNAAAARALRASAALTSSAHRVDQDVISGLMESYPPDATEERVADVADARALIAERRPDVFALLKRRRAVFRDAYGPEKDAYLDRAENAILLSMARLGVRHGSFGHDFHHYHNENHAMEILERRIGRVLEDMGVNALPGRDWLALALFATCHDLRQREPISFKHGIGANEAASAAETFRILDLSGFDRHVDEDLYLALEIMIAGSTFDATPRPPQNQFNTAEIVATGGPLAPKLADELDQTDPSWRANEKLNRALELALIASDLDTANVAEPFPELAASAGRLAAEREMRSGRSLDEGDSGQPVLGFLTGGQERYFFELHRFCSDLGRAVFGDGKLENSPKVRVLADKLRERFGQREPGSYSGGEVLATHLDLSASM
jgi:hypothetical protein